MTWTRHGHHIPGSIETIPRPDNVARCGGTSLCKECQTDALMFLEDLGKLSNVDLQQVMDPMSSAGFVMGKYQQKALETVYDYVKDRLEKTDSHITFSKDEVYIVWFVKVLQNWKALVSTSLPDQMYYEVTYDGDMRSTYLDAYRKWENICIKDSEVSDAQGN